MWTKLMQARRKLVAKRHFDLGPSGEILYVPWSTQNLVGRRTYIVPDPQTRELVLEAHARWTLGLEAAAYLAFAATCILMLAVPFQPALQLGVLGAACLLGLLSLPCAVAAAFQAAGARLARGADRTAAQAMVVHDHDLGGNVRIVQLIAIAMALGALWVAFNVYSQGNLQGALLVATAGAMGWLPLFLMMRYIVRMRRLREENARLESVVAERTAALRKLNQTLEERVRDQVRHIERLGQLKHFFAAPVAEMILNEKGFDPAKVHRRELTAVSIDLRGFTAFSETSEPEEVISVLRIYHAELGTQVNRCRATLEHFAGDGAMVFLNDPLEIPDHPMRALELAVALREAMQPHLREWRANGFDIGLGVGIATGYATIGAVGYEGRWEYAAIGTVCNLAARLCAEAKDGQIVVSRRFMSRLGDRSDLEPLGERPLKGLTRPVEMFNVRGLREIASAAET